jgi:hypothetical protein
MVEYPMLKLGGAAIALLALISPCSAGTVEISDNSTALPGLAHQTAAILANAGAAIRKTGNDLYVITANGLHCEGRSNNAVDFSAAEAGLETYSCRINSENTLGTAKGQPFGDAGIILEILGAIEGKMGEKVVFTDVAMGQSSTYVKTINCTIHTNIENFDNGGRWACVYTDGQ